VVFQRERSGDMDTAPDDPACAGFSWSTLRPSQVGPVWKPGACNSPPEAAPCRGHRKVFAEVRHKPLTARDSGVFFAAFLAQQPAMVRTQPSVCGSTRDRLSGKCRFSGRHPVFIHMSLKTRRANNAPAVPRRMAWTGGRCRTTFYVFREGPSQPAASSQARTGNIPQCFTMVPRWKRVKCRQLRSITIFPRKSEDVRVISHTTRTGASLRVERIERGF